MLEVKNLGMVYPDGTKALKNVSFSVDPGEFLVVIGLSGSGKSTLLRCINRLLDPCEGDIFLNGENVADIRNKERKIEEAKRVKEDNKFRGEKEREKVRKKEEAEKLKEEYTLAKEKLKEEIRNFKNTKTNRNEKKLFKAKIKAEKAKLKERYKPQNELRKIRRKIGMIFQHFNLVKRSNVMTNVLSGRLGYVNTARSVFHRFSADDMKKAREALEMVGLTEQAKKRADELSGGQQQRVGIARALMQDPEIILADEPVASLDPVLAHTILGYLEKLNKEKGITVICSLHYLDLVQRYASRVIGLKNGSIVYQGTGAEIRKMTDKQFKEVYGEDAQRINVSITGGPGEGGNK